MSNENIIDGEVIEATPRKTARKAPTKRSAAKIPANAPRPQDHRPKSAAQAEAEGASTVEVEWEGMSFEVLADPDAWNYWTVIEPASAGNIPAALRGLLGDEAMLRIRSVLPNANGPKMRELWDLVNRTLGFGSAGN